MGTPTAVRIAGILSAFLPIFFAMGSAWATTGTIAGKIMDAETGEPLGYANVMILDTHLGAASRLDGSFVIPNVPPGTYAVRVMMMSYSDGVRENVIVEAARTSQVDFELVPTVFTDVVPTVTSTGQRQHIHPEESMSVASIDTKELDVRPITTVDEAIATQAGVSRHGGEIRVRSGRASEVKRFTDGVQVSEPLFGGTSQGMSLASISNIVVLSGGFDAEYGNAQSGIINYVTREGGKTYSGMLKFMTDDFGGPDKTYFDTDNVLFGLGGPLAGDNLHFYVSGEASWSDTYLSTNEERNHYSIGPVSMHDRQQNTYSGQAKLTYFVTPTKKLDAEYLVSRESFELYDHAFSRTGFWSPAHEEWWPWAKDSTFTSYGGPEHTPNIRRTHETYKLSWKHILDARTFYTAHLSLFASQETQKVKDQAPWEYDPVFFQNDSYLDPANRYFVVRGDYPLWRRYRSEMVTARADVTKELLKVHQVRAGLVTNYYDLDMFEASYPSKDNPEGVYHDKYHLYSWGGALYVQDRMRYEGMIINAGLRWDLYDPGRKAVLSASQRLTELSEGAHKAALGSRIVTQLSPRLGMAYPISDRQVLHFHYGRFYEVPPLAFLYQYNGQRVTTGGTLVGNVFLKPQTTIAYEMGIEHEITRSLALDATIFYKDIFGLVGTSVETNEAVSTTRVAHSYYNKDYGSVRGFELSLNKQFSHRFSGSLSYTFSKATGSSSSERLGYQVAAGNFTREPITELPLDWDQTHMVNANLYVAQPGVWGVNLDLEYATGVPFTPTDLDDRETEPEEINAGRLPSTMEVNLRADKRYKVWGQEFSLFLDGRNLLDASNIFLLVPTTLHQGNYEAAYTMDGIVGGAYNEADVIESSNDRLVPLRDPEVYRAGRRFRVGIQIDW